jgi:hypothetical protein
MRLPCTNDAVRNVHGNTQLVEGISVRNGTANCCSVTASEDITLGCEYTRYRNASCRSESRNEATSVAFVTGGMFVRRRLMAIAAADPPLAWFRLGGTGGGTWCGTPLVIGDAERSLGSREVFGEEGAENRFLAVQENRGRTSAGPVANLCRKKGNGDFWP